MPDFRESVPLPVTESVLVKVAPGPALAGAYLWHRTMEASGRFDNLDEMLKEFFFLLTTSLFHFVAKQN